MYLQINFFHYMFDNIGIYIYSFFSIISFHLPAKNNGSFKKSTLSGANFKHSDGVRY